MKKIFLLLALISSSAQAQVSNNLEPSVLVYNTTRNRVEHASNKDTVRPIASISKIMTAMVTLDHDKDLSRTLKLSRQAGSYLPHQTYNRWQLLLAMLVRSDNAAAETLAQDYPGGRAAFVARMNSQAQEWGMTQTRFEDPTGLGANNTSTVTDTAEMMEISAGYWLIQEITTRKQVAVETQSKKSTRTMNLVNTNSPLLLEFDSIIVGKTGFTSKAGWCVGLVVEHKKSQYVVIVLGAKTKQDRIRAVEKIMYNHVINNQLLETELVISP
jgi:D-alanyl-D-alanine endopeptidase (penicillin-binding protein 7)